MVMHMPESFKVGDTALCRMNGVAELLTWRDQDTLVIGRFDARHIVKTHIENGVRCFICGDANNSQQARRGSHPFENAPATRAESGRGLAHGIANQATTMMIRARAAITMIAHSVTQIANGTRPKNKRT